MNQTSKETLAPGFPLGLFEPDSEGVLSFPRRGGVMAAGGVWSLESCVLGLPLAYDVDLGLKTMESCL